MIKNLFHSLIRNWVPVLIVIFLLVSTGGLILLQYQQVRDLRGTTIPLNLGTTGTGTEVTAVQGGSPGMPGSTQPISIKLSEGKAQPQPFVRIPLATGDPLPADQVAEILGRLPALSGEAGDQVPFKLPPELLPPPLPGMTVKESFPPAAQENPPGTAANEPLKVLRFSPEGSIPIAPFLSVTFNQPMVALDTLAGLAAADVPVRLEPSIPGTWRWLGTRTLTFQSDSTLFDRLPKATVYTATVPAGIKSAAGNALAEAVTWTFSTPPPVVTLSFPGGDAQPRDPIFFYDFDQRIDPPAVLETIKVTAGGVPVAVELVNEETVAADKRVKGLLQNAVAGRWLAFRAKDLLPADSSISVVIGPGTPSAEGLLTTETAQTFGFHTYAPLRIEDHGCSWGDTPCQPLTPFFIRFNNPIDTSLYKEDMLKIEPELPGASVNVYGNSITIQGESKGQTTYLVNVDGGIQDIYGQQLGSSQRLTFRVGPAEPVLVGPNANFITLDPAAKKPGLTIYTINYPRVNVRIYSVQPADWPAFKQYLRDFQRTDINVTVPGRKVFDKAVPIESAADTLTESTIDLSGVMDGKFGMFVVIVEPPKGLFTNKDPQYWQTVQTWAQVTQIGLDAYTDHSEMVVWTTALKDGSPLSEIKITAGETGAQFSTSADGTARVAIPNGATYLTASQGADQAILPRDPYFWNQEGWSQRPVSDELRWYVFDDRQMYRPGEEVHLKGWIRRIGGKQDGDVGLLGDTLSGVSYQVIDPQGNQIGSGRADANALGGFDFSFTLPEQVNLGYAQISLNAEGSFSNVYGQQFSHSMRIEEFRRPEFEVNARNESTGPYFAGGNAVLAVRANYYAGGPLPGADVTWQVTSSPGTYAPPNW
ncbi:MAG: Ig-like domain-containing protein, partial [Anaerolineaceae bacterium]|nr:Ig-like domain-containing protein [Anaerolineaceae bacterium]